jgi:hypothetical protein
MINLFDVIFEGGFSWRDYSNYSSFFPKFFQLPVSYGLEIKILQFSPCDVLSALWTHSHLHSILKKVA